MTVVQTAASLRAEDSAVTLPRYAQLIEYAECSFFGVRRSDVPQACRTIWQKHERDTIIKYLAEAQEELERVIRYPLNREWFADEQHPYRFPVKADWCKIVSGGVRATADIALAEAVAHATDPAVVGPVATTVTDEDEVRVYHPGTEVEIHPSAITISGGNLTIEIPRCRMVTEAASDNDPGGMDYDDLNNFESTVDIGRVYNDPSTHATLVWPHSCTSASYCGCTCDEYTQTACIYVRNGDLGFLDALPATYSSGTWATSCSTCCGMPEVMRVNYLAGVQSLSWQEEDAIVRLAHAKMPAAPCGCDVARRVWQRDRNVPDVLTRERINNPFGLSDGAWVSWQFARALKVHRGAVL